MNIHSDITIADICLKLRHIRNAQNLTLFEVEKLSGGRIKAVVLGSYERGARSLSVKRALEIAALYGIPADELFRGAPRKEISDPAKRTLDVRQLKKNFQQSAALTAVAHFAGEMQKRRNDWNGELISLRNTDFEILAITTLQSTQQLDDELSGKGILFARS